MFFLQVLEKWMGVFAVDVNLIEQIKVDLAIFNEALNFLGIARFLMPKLIAGKSENSQTCRKQLKVYKFFLLEGWVNEFKQFPPYLLSDVTKVFLQNHTIFHKIKTLKCFIFCVKWPMGILLILRSTEYKNHFLILLFFAMLVEFWWEHEEFWEGKTTKEK